jgi:hypothetical protein
MGDALHRLLTNMLNVGGTRWTHPLGRAHIAEPSDFPIGSPRSRAAARMLVQCREKNVRRFTLP